MANRLLGFVVRVVIRRRPALEPVGIPGGNIMLVQSLGLHNEVGRRLERIRQIRQEEAHAVPPSVEMRRVVHRLDGFLGRLLSGEASPLIAAGLACMLSVAKISLCLSVSVLRA